MTKETARLYKGVADEKRLRILLLLAERPRCVCELAHVLAITQPAISRHLKKLATAGFIGSRKDGFWTNYFLRMTNAHAKTVIMNVKKWLANDPVISADRKKAGRAKREQLCTVRKIRI